MSNVWIARDEDGELWVYENKPLKGSKIFEPDGHAIAISPRLFPNITWENSPRELVVKEE